MTSYAESTVPAVGNKLKQNLTKKRKRPGLWKNKGIKDRHLPLVHRAKIKPDRQCSFCLSNHHAKLARPKAKVPQAANCPVFDSEAGLEGPACKNEYCPNRNDHVTLACPTLQSRCEQCRCRGHLPDHCSRLDLVDLRRDFHAIALEGKYTSLLHEHVSWGFYPIDSPSKFGRSDVGWSPRISYSTLNSMPATLALRAVLEENKYLQTTLYQYPPLARKP